MEDSQVGELDQMLDRALAAYAPMPPGLEGRVLQQVAQLESKRRGRRMYALGSLVLAASLLAVFVPQKPAPQSPTTHLTSLKVKTESQPLHQPLLQRVAHRKRVKQTQRVLKASVFPSPTPMTSEERALVRFVQQSPEAAAAVFADLEKQREEPLHIEALNIVPLAEERSK